MQASFRTHTVAGIGGRLGIFLMLLAGLLLPAQEYEYRSIHRVILIDESGSVAAGQTGAVLSRLDAGSETSVVKYGVNAVTPLYTSHSGSDNSLAPVLQQVIWSLDPGSANAIVIASDGYWKPDAVDTLLVAQQAGLPVLWIPLQSARPTAAISSLAAPVRARPGQQISVAIRTLQTDGQSTEIVLFVDRLPVMRSRVSSDGTVVLPITAANQGPLLIGAELRDLSSGRLLDQWREAALINIAAVPDILLVSAGLSTIGESLLAGGWPVHSVTPQQFPMVSENLRQYASVILDDVAIADIPESSWATLVSAIRDKALGLLVLGGPNSFGLGGYRNSQLEAVLPLVSEPPDDEPPVDLLFLIDVSGSMQGADKKADRLRSARTSVLAASNTLRSIDRVGLITFDVDVRELLPLRARTDHQLAISEVWPRQASGGTSIMQALQQATAVLNQPPRTTITDVSQQKILMLVTDGFIADNELSQFDTALAGSVFELIMLLIDETDSVNTERLAKIVEAHGGTVLRVNNILHLPVLMRGELEARRPAVIEASVRPVSLSPAWLPQDSLWPPIDRYLLTRPKRTAQVHLASPRGEALIASISTGAGKVVAITPGLGNWAGEWPEWDKWPDLVAALVNYIGVQDSGEIRISTGSVSADVVEIMLETMECGFQPVVQDPVAVGYAIESGENCSLDLNVFLITPSGEIKRPGLEFEAPRQYRSTVPVTSFGEYTVIVDDGSVTSRHQFLHLPVGEPLPAGRPIAEQWLSEGLVRRWEPDSLETLNQNNNRSTWLIVFALLGFLILLILERLPVGVFKRRKG